MKAHLQIHLIVGLLLSTPNFYFSQVCGVAQNLSATQESDLQIVYANLETALQTQNYSNVFQFNLDAKSIFGNQAGIPEVIENYTNLTQQNTWLNLTETLNLSRQFIDANESILSNLWKLAKGMKPNTDLPHSLPLRTSAENAIGLLKIASKETDVVRKNNYIEWATKALDSLASMQLTSGAFPFPDLRSYNDPVFSPIIQNYLNVLGADSVNVLQNGWIVDDSGTGEFKFDAGVIANAFYEAYMLTGNPNYQVICINIADYLLPLNLNVNYNYNSFVALGLARGFQLSVNSNYLDRAILNIKNGILPGQIENGRWMDGHNAKSVYHQLIIKNCAPLFESITTAVPEYDAFLQMEMKAIRNLIEYTNTCGAATGFQWLLSSQLSAEDHFTTSLNDSIQELIGRYIQKASSTHDFLDIESLGMYIELLSELSIVKELSSNQFIRAYPNPVKSKLTINLSQENSELVLRNSLGQECLKLNASGQITLDFSQLSRGIYGLQVYNSNGVHFIKIEKN